MWPKSTLEISSESKIETTMTMAACPGNQELLFWRDHIPKESLSPASCRGDSAWALYFVPQANPSDFIIIIFEFIVNRKMPSYSSSRSATCCCGFANLVDLCRFHKTDSLRPLVVTQSPRQPSTPRDTCTPPYWAVPLIESFCFFFVYSQRVTSAGDSPKKPQLAAAAVPGA